MFQRTKLSVIRGRILVHSKVANFATPMLGDRRTYDFRKPNANKSQLCEFTQLVIMITYEIKPSVIGDLLNTRGKPLREP